MIVPEKGQLLVSEPFLPDMNFHRSVILVTEHNNGSHSGFILNKPTDVQLSEIFEIENAEQYSLALGGPVEPDTMHFLHTRPDLIQGGQQIAGSLHWGGDFDAVKEGMQNKVLSIRDIRFFLGYAGWTTGQLAGEVEHESWFVCEYQPDLVFSTEPSFIWQECLKRMGGRYELLVNSPEDPQWN